MPYYQGKKRSIGLAIESVRGTKKNPTYWFPWTDSDFSPKIETKDDESSFGTLVGSTDSQIVKEYSEGNIGGKIYPNGIGFLLLAALGKVTTVTTGSNPVHTFSIDENNAHPSLTMSTTDPVAQWQYPLTVVNSLQISAEVGGDIRVTASLKGKKAQTATGLTVAYTNEESFKSSNMNVIIADNLTALNTANNVCLQSFDLTITKEMEDIPCIGSKENLDYANKSIKIEGSMELYRTSNTYRDMAFNSIAKAMRVQIIDDSVALAGGEHPELKIDLARAKFNRSDAVSLNDIIKQSVSFVGHYSIAEAKAIEAMLRNTQTAY